MPIVTPDDVEVITVIQDANVEVVTVEVPGVRGPQGDTGATGSAGTNGTNGSPGPANVLSIGTVSSGTAAASITGTSPTQVLNLTIPTGATGPAGPSNTLAIGTVTTGSPGSSASATITGSSPNYTLNLTIPRGDTGTVGTHTHVAADITDSTTVGRAVLTAVDAAAGRTAIGAGTSNLAIGTTGSTAKAGDYQPTAANISDSTSVGRSVLTATDAAAARTAIGAGTSSLALGTTNTTAKAGDYQPTSANISDATSAATVSRVVIRDAAGRAQFVDPSVAADAATKGYTDTGLGTKANNTITISAGTGLTGGGDLTANRTLTVAYGSSASTAVQGNDARVVADQAAGTASIRTIGTGALQAAAGNHTHTATGISDSTSTGRSLMTATDAAAARSTLGVDAAMTFTATKTATYTVAANEIAVMNVSGGGSTLNLPTSPTAGMRVGFQAIGATTGTPLTINRGGTATIGDAGATTDTTPLAGVVRVYEYDNANTRWIAVQDFKPLTALDSRFAAASHTHTASQISDSTTIGRSVLTAADAAAVRTAISAPFGNGITEVRLLTQATYDGIGSPSSSTLYVIVG